MQVKQIETTEAVISDGSGGKMVLAFTGQPSQVATKFFSDAARHLKNNSINLSTQQKVKPKSI